MTKDSYEHAMSICEPGTISEHVWNDKYRFEGENLFGTFRRVAKAVAAAEDNEDETFQPHWEQKFFDILKSFEFIPAGRILAGAGTGRGVTLFNCYVMGAIPDSIWGIFESLKEAALTLKQGGGVGMDFSTLRPRGAMVNTVQAPSSGAVSFMRCWDSMCSTIMSAGNRRGAMMATLRCDHPDIEEFIEAKRQPNNGLTNFNISVLVTDKFMDAVQCRKPWPLMFDGKVYRTVMAHELWDKIMRSNYAAAEPGVIFIDHVNRMNQLRDIETISATNPCGEQPLPPYGACNLGSINLTQIVLNPFTEDAAFNFKRLKELVPIAVRFLDNVIDVAYYPLTQQQAESYSKRRIGLGVTGLGDALAMLGVAYDSEAGRKIAAEIAEAILDLALTTSKELARERGPFPAWIDNKKMGPRRRNSHLLSIAPTGTISLFAGNVSSGIEPIFSLKQERAVLQSDGTRKTFMATDYAFHRYNHPEMNEAFWKTAEEIEPNDHLAMVAVWQKYVDSAVSKTINCAADISFDDFRGIYTRAYAMGLKGCTTYRPNEVTGSVLRKVAEEEAKAKAYQDKKTSEAIEELATKAGAQLGDGPIRAHIFKAPLFTSDSKEKVIGGQFETFDIELSQVKPPADSRGAKYDFKILPGMHVHMPDGKTHFLRPEKIDGTTYKLKPPGAEHALYVTINHIEDLGGMRPFEIFFNTKQVESWAWMTALSRMISAVFRKGGDVHFVVEELRAVFDPRGGFWKAGTNGARGYQVPSIIAGIGELIEEHMKSIGYSEDEPELDMEGFTTAIPEPEIETGIEEQRVGADVYEVMVQYCPKCNGHLTKREGCMCCTRCDYTKC